MSRIDLTTPDNGKWTWTSTNTTIQAGPCWIVLAGREDGFEVDKIVVTKGACPNGSGPAESPTL